ncbi:hypothetical protein LEP1GSC088_0078 [Leptospira interrogans str. L1207]|nr:hypothetical protein LEP1GSC088_0078 [Leptospira interrogans str. L1207]EMN54341.1 hypothetical protein LEP1GSC089_3707 [Leptospira interrogans serovar Autumnalis str. LP101]
MYGGDFLSHNFFAKSILIESSTNWEFWIQHSFTQTKCFSFFWTAFGVLF